MHYIHYWVTWKGFHMPLTFTHFVTWHPLTSTHFFENYCSRPTPSSAQHLSQGKNIYMVFKNGFKKCDIEAHLKILKYFEKGNFFYINLLDWLITQFLCRM